VSGEGKSRVWNSSHIRAGNRRSAGHPRENTPEGRRDGDSVEWTVKRRLAGRSPAWPRWMTTRASMPPAKRLGEAEADVAFAGTLIVEIAALGHEGGKGAQHDFSKALHRRITLPALRGVAAGRILGNIAQTAIESSQEH